MGGAVLVALYVLLSVKHESGFSGIVLDADTDQPLAGVVLVNSWSLYGGLEGGNYFGPVKVSEAVTDASGAFHFSGWWKVISPSLMLNTVPGLRDALITFKPGFDTVGEGTLSQDRSSITIRLRRFAGTDLEYSTKLTIVEIDLHDTLTTGILHCAGRQVPEMLAALGRQDRAFEAAGIKHNGILNPYAGDAGTPSLVAQHCDDIIGLISGKTS